MIMMTPPDAVHLSITTPAGRTYSAPAGGTVLVHDMDAPCLLANGWGESSATSAVLIALLTSEVATLQAQVAATGVGSGGVSQSLYPVASFTAGQVTFPLPVTPAINSDVGLVVNGVEYLSPDVTVSADGTTLTWAGSFTLDPATATLFIRYH